MNNNDFMHILTQVSKNNNQKQQLIITRIIAVLAIMGCVALYKRYTNLNKTYISVNKRNETNIYEINRKNMQIGQLQNIINQLRIDNKRQDISNESAPDISPIL